MAGNRLAASAKLLAVALLTLLLGACVAGDAPPAPTPTAGADAGVGSPGPAEPCAQARLRIGDLPAIDATIADGVATAREEGRAWRDDARLVAVRVGCRLLAPTFRWDVTFFSPSARSTYSTGSADTEPVDDDPAAVRDLPTDALSFADLRRSLTGAGYDDALFLSPTGITVRTSTNEHPFGPPAAPRDAVYYHVAIDVRGEVDDLFVAVAGGTVYRYDA